MNEEAVSIWIRRAENDLKIGKDELDTPEPATDAVCFHMQQCVEKYLKAFLVFHGKEFPRSHDITLLLSLCSQVDADFTLLMEWGVDTLTDYAVTVRYEEPIFPSVEEAKMALDLVEKVRQFVRGKLAEGGFMLP
ncbi:MAG: nucleotidyltransferase [Fimbriimonadales bacterium]|nr:MAG: nucleotidyltransferase [Fimbriimonadales bacterium]